MPWPDDRRAAPRPHQCAAAPPWLSIVGIGEDGVAGLGAEARRLIAAAQIVFGGRRHLALAAPLIRGAAQLWPSPFAGAAAAVLAHRGRPVCALATGDPLHYGVGAVLASRVAAAEMRVVPAPSAFSLAAARLGWPLPQLVLLSLHGRALDRVRAHLQPGARILALSSGSDTAAALARLLAQSGFGACRLTVLEALGGPRERVRSASATAFDLTGIDPLNILAVEVEAGPQARVVARAAGRADTLFAHDGQITKREIRAATLAALAPRRGELLWDIGAGAGSVAVEWLLADPGFMRAVAVEERADRAARIRVNAAALGVPELGVVEGAAPAALAGLPRPDAVFVGGGAGEGVLDVAAGALAPGGRLVVNAVTLQTEALLMARHAALGGELVRIAIARAAPLGALTGWRPARPVTQWTWTKPWDTKPWDTKPWDTKPWDSAP